MKTFLQAAVLATVMTVPLVVVLSSCAPNTNGHGPAPEPQAPPKPRPTATPRIFKLDKVVRAQREEIKYQLFTSYNSVPLSMRSVVIWENNDRERIRIPLRPLGEQMGYGVDWNPRKRRVKFFRNGKLRLTSNSANSPILLMAGRSYMAANAVEQWLSVTVQERLKGSPETTEIEIVGKKLKR